MTPWVSSDYIVQNDGGGGSCGDVGDDDDDLCIIFARNILLQTSESLQISLWTQYISERQRGTCCFMKTICVCYLYDTSWIRTASPRIGNLSVSGGGRQVYSVHKVATARALFVSSINLLLLLLLLYVQVICSYPSTWEF